MNEVTIIPLVNLLLGFLPVILLITVMKFWGLDALQSVYANFRMLIQLLLIGYVLTYIFETDEPIIVLFVVLFIDRNGGTQPFCPAMEVVGTFCAPRRNFFESFSRITYIIYDENTFVCFSR
mgnify:CR=1 FL=1